MQHVNLLFVEWVGLSLSYFFELILCELLLLFPSIVLASNYLKIHTLVVDACAVMYVRKVSGAKYMYSVEVWLKINDDCVLDGGLPQCRLEGTECPEVSWILLQDIPLSAGTREEGRCECLRAEVWIPEPAAVTSGG